MRIYLAGPFSDNRYDHIPKLKQYPHYLESYHYIGKQRFVDMIRGYRAKVFLDSGAFSAFTQNVVIDMKEYAAYIGRNKDIIEFASNLDAIEQDRAVGAEKTWENQRKLEELAKGTGIYIIPVYHMREPLSALERLIGKYPFIALGGMVPESTSDLRELLDDLWDRVLTDKDGKPRVRVHGFGMTTFELMLRYPWWSADSTSWKMYGIMGRINILTKAGKPTSIPISGKHSRRRNLGEHYDSMSPLQQHEIKTVVEGFGHTIDQVRESEYMRTAVNLYFFTNMMGRNAHTFKKQKGDLFA